MTANRDLPHQLQYLIKELNDDKTRMELRANYLYQLKDIRDKLDKEITNFEKVYNR